MSVRILVGDCRQRMVELAENSVDSVVCDPPYHLLSTVKRFGKVPRTESTMPKSEPHARMSRGFMGQTWDGGDVAFDPATWAEVLRVLKPGGHLVAFSGTRTYHRMAVAIEDAGFEVRDQLAWVYGSGFPKSHNQPGGWGTALKPAWEPICLARKPLIGTVAGNMAAHGTGAINIDGCRISTEEELRAGAGAIPCRHNPDTPRGRAGEASATRRYQQQGSTDFAATPGPRGGDPLGRWPANIIHDGSDEVVAAFPADAGGGRPKEGGCPVTTVYNPGGTRSQVWHQDSGSAARFFYCAKATSDERGEGNNHPTVKPIALMQWLVRLVTPVGGTVLDPFMGSGSTGVACQREQFSFIGCEMSPDYATIAERRLRADAGMFADVIAA